MRRLLALVPAGLLTSCSSSVMFSVAVDEPVDHGSITLNGNSGALMRNIDGAYWAKWSGGDADGSIEVVFPDGAAVTCRVGYVTQRMEVQKFAVRDRQCETVG